MRLIKNIPTPFNLEVVKETDVEGGTKDVEGKEDFVAEKLL